MVMSEPADTNDFRRWWRVQTKAPYPVEALLETQKEPPPAMKPTTVR
jgi:hypothetical protein